MVPSLALIGCITRSMLRTYLRSFQDEKLIMCSCLHIVLKSLITCWKTNVIGVAAWCCWCKHIEWRWEVDDPHCICMCAAEMPQGTSRFLFLSATTCKALLPSLLCFLGRLKKAVIVCDVDNECAKDLILLWSSRKWWVWSVSPSLYQLCAMACARLPSLLCKCASFTYTVWAVVCSTLALLDAFSHVCMIAMYSHRAEGLGTPPLHTWTKLYHSCCFACFCRTIDSTCNGKLFVLQRILNNLVGLKQKCPSAVTVWVWVVTIQHIGLIVSYYL